MAVGKKTKPIISVVAPVYNEEECISEFLSRTISVLEKINKSSEIVIIDDGSTDETIKKLIHFKQNYLLKKNTSKKVDIRVGKLSRNNGHQKALLCGMNEALGSAVITIDSDLQDPPEKILDLLKGYSQGYEIIVMKRNNRSVSDNLFKKLTAKFFYKFIFLVSDNPSEPEVGDFRLLSRRFNRSAVEVSAGSEYIRGNINLLGPKPYYISYLRDPRYGGKSKYSLSKMLGLALNAVVKSSLKPLRKSIHLGITALLLSIIYSIYVFIQKLFYPETLIQGYTTLLVVMLWGFSVVLVLISTLAQYVVRIIEESSMTIRLKVEKWL
jgi:dolichol-phosphate mannosyltransferase